MASVSRNAGLLHGRDGDGNETISIAPGIGVEKDDRRIVLVDDLDWQLPSIPLGNDGADKALPTFRMPLVPLPGFQGQGNIARNDPLAASLPFLTPHHIHGFQSWQPCVGVGRHEVRASQKPPLVMSHKMGELPASWLHCSSVGELR